MTFCIFCFLQQDDKRKEKVSKLLDKFLEQYLTHLEQFSPVQPAVLLLKEMFKSGNIQNAVFEDMEGVEASLFTVCHR